MMGFDHVNMNALKAEKAGLSYAPSPSEQPPQLISADAQQRLWNIEGVEGIGEADGAVVVFIRDPRIAASLPDEIEGYPVVVRVSGEIRAL